MKNKHQISQKTVFGTSGTHSKLLIFENFRVGSQNFGRKGITQLFFVRFCCSFDMMLRVNLNFRTIYFAQNSISPTLDLCNHRFFSACFFAYFLTKLCRFQPIFQYFIYVLWMLNSRSSGARKVGLRDFEFP